MKQDQIIFEVSKISWERVFLNLEISTNYIGKVEFRLERIKKANQIIVLERVPLSFQNEENHRFLFVCNIVAMNGRSFLENGIWRIMASTAEKDYVCYVAHEVAYHFDDYSRIFRYGSKYAYNISFHTLTEDEKYLWFVMDSYFMIMNDRWNKRHYVQEAVTAFGKLKRIHMTVAICLIRMFYWLWAHIFPKKGNRILLMSETRDCLWGNLKAIDNRIKERGLDQQFDISYSFRKAVGSHMSIRSWVGLVFKLAQQDYIFVDDYVPIFGFLNLDSRTKLIQVWHAGEGFKAVGYCRFGKDGSPFPVGSCHKKYDYVLTGSQKLVKVFAEVFGIEESAFLPVGMPRLDGFLDDKKIRSFQEEFYGEYPALKNKKLILFAPTYRGTGQKDAYYDYSWLKLNEIYDFCKDKYVFLVKMHPFTNNSMSIPEEYKDRIIDFSLYSNINDLYYVTDILITDYSSNYYEYSLLKRPVVFFTPDREIYELSRGVHRGVRESAPGKVCDTFDELMETLRNEDFQIEKIHKFVEDNFGDYDGHAADHAIDQILLANKK